VLFPLAEDRDYILDAINGMFPTVHLKPEDVESSWAGVRPLIQEEGKSPSEISRKDEIIISDSGLISIAGGKLTGYRKMAERVVDEVTSELEKETGKTYPGCRTVHAELSGGHFGGSEHYLEYIRKTVADGVQLGLEEKEAEKLARKHGKNTGILFDLIRSNRDEAEKHHLPPAVFATIEYALTHEMAVSPVDYFTRRTGKTLFVNHWAKKWEQPVLDYMAYRLSWSQEQKTHYQQELEAAFDEATIQPVVSDPKSVPSI
jgi:Glycerol-3-phosphate dehydrogenase